jgi:hypothetical protein
MVKKGGCGYIYSPDLTKMGTIRKPQEVDLD